MSNFAEKWPPVARNLNGHTTSAVGAFTTQQSRAILIVGLTCAAASLLAALISMRWFILMRRSYRHHLILFLIMSDTWKSLWFFVYPVVDFSGHHGVASTSTFCQASGFFLSVGFETSDFAILAIALHAILYVFQRPQIKGEGGLYPYRKYVYVAWIALPLLAASLAFINPQTAYVTSGTFCYLPKRPFWYRLALSYIPRYLIFITIFGMYAAIYLYVHIKFKDFDDFGIDHGSGSASHQYSTNDQSRKGSNADRISVLLSEEGRMKASSNSQPDPIERPPWEGVSFITSKTQQDFGVAPTDFAQDEGSSSTDTHIPSRHLSVHSTDGHIPYPRKPSEIPSGTNLTGDTVAAPNRTSFFIKPTFHSRPTTDPLQSTRNAIRRQLRFLFVYPAVYLLMWTFPFANHCLLYSDHYVRHPPFWLSLLSTLSLSLQGGVDCVVFSIRERPWRRIDESAPGSWTWTINLMRGLSKKTDTKTMANKPGVELDDKPEAKRGSDWWVAEGMKRKDSVWMGTDTLQQIISRQAADELEEDVRRDG